MKPRVAANTAVLAALKVGAPLCSLLLVLAVTRKLGAEGLGRYSLAYAYLALFSLLGPLGLPALITREGARDAGALERLLANGVTLGGGVSVALVLAMAGSSQLFGYDAATARALAVLSLALPPSTCLTYFDAAFLALESTWPMAVATLGEHVIKVGLGLLLLFEGSGLEAVLGAAVAGRLAACAISIALLRRLGVRLPLRIEMAALRFLMVEAPVFALSAICATLYWRIDVFLLARFRGLREVGYYTAAYRILDLAILLPQSLCHSLYPGLAAERCGERSPQAAALGWLSLLTAPAALVVTILAGPLLGRLYGPGFVTAAPMLAILIWTALPYAWNRYQAYVLVAADRQRADLAINAGLLAVNVASNLVLIPRYGGLGAAAVTLGTALLYGAVQFSLLRLRPTATAMESA